MIAIVTAWPVFWSQLTGSWIRPKPIRIPFAIPKCVSKMMRQKMPATTEAMAHGRSTAMKKMLDPRNPRLRTRAVTKARGRVTAVVSAARTTVRGMASRISWSWGSLVR